MKEPDQAPVLAIGIDSAETKLVRLMIEQDELPVLKSLCSAGEWIRLEATTIGTSSVWPTFLTGRDPHDHNIYCEWCWDPAKMNLSRVNARRLQPFWKEIADGGKRIGILAVPFMPLIGLEQGFEIPEPYPYVAPESEAYLPRLTETISPEAARAALSHGRVHVLGPEDHKHLSELARDALNGVKRRADLADQLLTETRPDFSILVFTEAHELGHCLWQTFQPEHEYFEGLDLSSIKPSLKEIYQQVDTQIGRLVERVGPSASVLVFSLHGLEPARGVPTFLTSIMCELGFARLADMHSLSWRDRARGFTKAVKQRIPAKLKMVSYRAFSRDAFVKWALPTMLPRYDWSQTRAFSLVEEQHGAIRVNLKGREAQGIVSVEEYDEICREIECAMRALRTDDGKPLAHDVIRTAKNGEEALSRGIPDILVPWEMAAYRSPLRIVGSPAEFFPEGRRYVGQHTSEGFCIFKASGNRNVDPVLPIRDLGRLMIDMLAANLRVAKPPAAN